MSTEERFEKMVNQVSEIHAVVLGVDGQGGLHRQVQEHEAEIAELKQGRAKLVGMFAGASAVVSGVASWLFGSGK